MRERWQAGVARSRPGRPARHLDAELAFIMALNGVTHAEIARHFGCDRKTLERHCRAVLTRAAQSRAALLPPSLWQRGANSPDKLQARAAGIQLADLDLEKIEAALKAAHQEPINFLDRDLLFSSQQRRRQSAQRN